MTHKTRKAAQEYLANNGFTKGKGGKWINLATNREAKLGPMTKTGVRIFYGSLQNGA